MNGYDKNNLFRAPVNMRNQGDGRFIGQPRNLPAHTDPTAKLILESIKAGTKLPMDKHLYDKEVETDTVDIPKHNALKTGPIASLILWACLVAAYFIFKAVTK